MTRDDKVWGSRSAIQKAVRRGDLDLAKTALDALWTDKQHKSWLRWRVVSIVQEDCLPMIGEIPALYSALAEVKKDSPEELAVWKIFFYRCCLCPATKDAAGLINLARDLDYESNHMEALIAAQFAQNLDQDTVGSTADAAAEWAHEKRPLSPYESAAVELLRKRASMGGMFGDQVVPLAAIPIIVFRGLDPDKLKEQIKEGAKRWEAEVKRTKPKTVELPWYCFDMHTQVGKIALGAVSRREKIDKEVLFRVWFMCESARHPPWHVHWTDVKGAPSMFEAMWWKEWIKRSLTKTGKPAREVLETWRDVTRTKVENMVTYLLRVREKEK